MGRVTGKVESEARGGNEVGESVKLKKCSECSHLRLWLIVQMQSHGGSRVAVKLHAPPATPSCVSSTQFDDFNAEIW